jgi:hypothetical protein
VVELLLCADVDQMATVNAAYGAEGADLYRDLARSGEQPARDDRGFDALSGNGRYRLTVGRMDVAPVADERAVQIDGEKR